jgi:hypothetical protein
MRRRKLVLRASTVRQLVGADLETPRGGADRPPITVTCPCITPQCPGDYTANCPF